MAMPVLIGKMATIAQDTNGNKQLIKSGILNVTLTPEAEKLDAFRSPLNSVGPRQKYQSITVQQTFTGEITLDHVDNSTLDFWNYHQKEGTIPSGSEYLAVTENDSAKLIPSGTPEVEVAGIVNTATPVLCTISQAGTGLQIPLEQVATGDVTPLTANQFRLKDSVLNPGVDSIFEFHSSQAGNSFDFVYWRNETAAADILNVIGGETTYNPYGEFSLITGYEIYGEGATPARRRVIMPRVKFQDDVGSPIVEYGKELTLPVDIFVSATWQLPYRDELVS